MSEMMRAGDFKAKCLKVMDRVKRTRRKVIITKHNVPVAELVPIKKEEERPIFGRMKGTIKIKKDIIKPIDVEWDVYS